MFSTKPVTTGKSNQPAQRPILVALEIYFWEILSVEVFNNVLNEFQRFWRTKQGNEKHITNAARCKIEAKSKNCEHMWKC